MENKYTISAVLTIVDGWLVLVFIGFFTVISLFTGGFGEASSYGLYGLLVYILLAAFCVLRIRVGRHLLKGTQATYKWTLPVLIISLVSVPLGTIAGVLYLYQRFMRERV